MTGWAFCFLMCTENWFTDVLSGFLNGQHKPIKLKKKNNLIQSVNFTILSSEVCW